MRCRGNPRLPVYQTFGPTGNSARLKETLRLQRRLVGYDNERHKGHHRHLEGKEEPYSFSTPERLIEDFLADVRRLRGES